MMKRKFDEKLIRELISNDLFSFVVVSLISADTIINLETARESLKYIMEIKEVVSGMTFDSEDKKESILKTLNDCTDIANDEIKKYNNEQTKE